MAGVSATELTLFFVSVSLSLGRVSVEFHHWTDVLSEDYRYLGRRQDLRRSDTIYLCLNYISVQYKDSLALVGVFSIFNLPNTGHRIVLQIFTNGVVSR